MAFDQTWEQIHRNREWGRYPKEELVRFVARNYYNAPQRPAVKFLDLGCGAGASVGYLRHEGFNVTPVDGSMTAIKRTKTGVVADAMRLPFADGSFDCVIDIVCIAHNILEDEKLIVAEAARVLKPNGKLFSMMPTNGCNRGPYQGKGHVTFLMRYQVTQLFNQLFTTEVDWSSFSDGNKVIEHWVINANKLKGA